ncbi:MAG: TfoX/Sxy family protein [Patescibacteria group bacterium]
MTDDSFKDFVVDQLEGLPDIHVRKMFGGYGIYSEGIFFAVIADGVLYFKTNEETREKYIAKDMDCFRPNEKQVLKNYYEVPSDVLESTEEIKKWAEEAIHISARSK